MKRSLKWIVLGTALLSLGAPWVLTGCGDAGGKADYRSPVMMTVEISDEEGEEGGCDWKPWVDVTDGSFECIPLEFHNYALDPDPIDTSFYMDIILQDYTVSFTRLDSGHDVPASFTAPINATLPVDGTLTIDTLWLRLEQKYQVPLNYLSCEESYGYEPATGLFEMHCGVHVHVRGRTLAGQAVTADCSWYVSFSDYTCTGGR